VVALDTDRTELDQVAAVAAAMDEAGEIPAGASIRSAAGDATAMPFDDGAFDIVIASEVMEHIPADAAALREVARVMRPGGTAAVTVPSWFPERVCWLLSDDYHNVPGGHVRIFTRQELEAKLRQAGLVVGGHHRAHALHSPYWWLKCAVGVHDDGHPLASAYHKLLVWDIMRKPAVTRLADQALNPLIGKSLVVYASKPLTTAREPRDDRGGLAPARTGAAASTAPEGAHAAA
jgi:SAM-dependent methyltransferase